MAFRQILSSFGPLPIKTTFTVPADGPVDFYVTSTAWTNTPNSFIGIAVFVNGVHHTVTMFANPTAQHMTLPTLFFTADIADPTAQQTISITANSPSTVTDQNDFFTVWAQY